MKKLICLALALVLVLSLAACGDKPQQTPAQNTQPAETPGNDAPAAPAEPAGAGEGEYYQAGNFKAFVPKGWKAFEQHDVFNDDPKAMNPNMLMIGKGASSDMDLYSKPAITINYAGKATKMMAPSRSFYDNVKDMGELKTGNHTWSVFSCESMGQKLYMLFEDLGVIQYQAAVTYETNGGKVSLEDADVQAILAGIEATNAEDLAAQGAGGGTAQPPATPPAKLENAEALARFRGDWNGAMLFYNCTGQYKSVETGTPVGAIGRFTVADDGTITPFIGIDVEDTPFKDLTAKYDKEKDCLLLSGSWIGAQFKDFPLTEKNGTLTFYFGVEKEGSSLAMAINLRRLDDEGWTDEYPKLGQNQIDYCKGKSFDELAELVGYKPGSYPAPDKQ